MQLCKLDEFNRVYFLDSFQSDLDKLYKKNQKEKKEYMFFLFAQLSKIEHRNENIKHVEPIEYKDVTFHCIRKKTKKNTRVLYYYLDDNKIVLLTAFNEKNKSDYDRGKELAYNRLKKIKNDYL